MLTLAQQCSHCSGRIVSASPVPPVFPMPSLFSRTSICSFGTPGCGPGGISALASCMCFLATSQLCPGRPTKFSTNFIHSGTWTVFHESTDGIARRT